MPSILVTGASRGFGRALVDVCRKREWTVFPLVRRAEDAEQLRAPNCHPICADVAFPSVEEAIPRVLAEHAAPLDVVVNNAGQVKKLRWLPATEAEDIEELFRVHCVGAFRCTRASLPFLRKASRPIVVNITSRFGSVTRVDGGEFRGIYSYSIAKSAVNMLTACLDQELRRDGVRVFAVHPGKLRTAAGAVDADMEPETAAATLVDWLGSVDCNAPCGIHDLMSGAMIPW